MIGEAPEQECWARPDVCPVKVIATLGPSTMSPEIVRAMIRAGAAGFRINSSHGSPGLWEEMIRLVEEASEREGVLPALVFDLEGPRLRVRWAPGGRVEPGQRVRICREPGEGCIVLNYPEALDVIEPGDTILIDDGKTVLRVEEAGQGVVSATVLTGTSVEPGKGVVVRGKHVPLPPLTEKDRECLDWLAGKPVSHVMLSYTQGPEHVRLLRRELEERGLGGVSVMAKIETPGAVERIEEIARESDAVVIARGDLGMHYPLEEIPRISTRIASAAVEEHAPLVMATEILASMVERPVPTRAEIVDIYRAVELGADALLLTAETAIGRYPVRAVEWAARTASIAWREAHSLPRPPARDTAESLALAILEMAEDLGAPIVIYSMAGRLPARIAQFKPRVKVYAGTPSPEAYRRLMLLHSVNPILVEADGYVRGLEQTLERVKRLGLEGVLVEAAWSEETHVFQVRIRNIAY